METNKNIEDQINAALESVKKIQPAELPYGFSDKVMNKLHAKEEKADNVRSIFTLSPLVRIAAIFILVLINVFTLRLAFNSQPAPVQAQYATIKDFVNGYQINDTNEELLTSNTNTAHE